MIAIGFLLATLGCGCAWLWSHIDHMGYATSAYSGFLGLAGVLGILIIILWTANWLWVHA